MFSNYAKLIMLDIKLNLRLYVLMAIQSLLAFLLIGVSCFVADTYEYRTSVLDSYTFSDNYYGGIETKIYTEHGIILTPEDVRNREKLNYFIAENFKTEGCVYPEFYYENENEEEKDIEGVAFVTEGYFNLFNLKLQEGRYFTPEEFGTQTLENTPVIMGAGYKNKYKLGDKYKGKYEIVGFLEQDSMIMLLSGKESQPISEEQSVYMPVKSLDFMKANDLSYPISLIYTKNKAELKKINDYANYLGLYPFNFVSLSENKSMINSFENQLNTPLLVISLIIMLLALLCLIQAMLEFVRKNTVELLIHMMCGARLSDIIVRVGAGTLLTAFLSAGAASLIFRSAGTTAVMFITAAAVVVISLIPVAVRLKRKPLITAVKEEK